MPLSRGLEYYITLPETSTLNSPSDDDIEDDFVHVPRGEKCPVIVLLGWINCKDKYLSKYADIYHERGYITIRCMYPLSLLMFKFFRLITLAQTLLNILKEESFDDHPIFFHVFSNGGCFLYQYVLNEIKLQNLPLNIRGCIIDSAPNKTGFSSVYRTICSIISGPLGKVAGVLAFIYMTLLYTVLVFLRHFVTKSLLSGNVWGNLAVAPTLPQLFIYSEDDQLVSCKHVEEFIAKRKEQGVPLTVWKLQSSPHVMHLKTDRPKYIATITQFLQNCLQ